MDFKALKNIDIQFRHLRLYIIAFTLLCLGVCICTVVMSYRFAEEQRRKVYVLDNGKSLTLALAQDAASNRPVEAREHIRRFHELFFTLSPDKKAIEYNINRALNLADKTPYYYYKDLAEKGYYNQIVTGNVIQSVRIDSIKCDFNHYPYQAVTYGYQIMKRESSVTYRNLVTALELVNSVRSDDNPQGFLVRKFKVIDNRDIRTESFN